MKEKHIILRMTGAGTRDADSSAVPFEVGSPAGIAVEIDSLDNADLPRIARSRDVVAVAPSIPMMLIGAWLIWRAWSRPPVAPEA